MPIHTTQKALHMQIKKTNIPTQSLLFPDHTKYDYSDSYEFLLRDPKNEISLLDIGKRFISPGPKWVGQLLALRNKIAGLFNLKTPNDKNGTTHIPNAQWEIGNRMGIFKIFDKTPNEFILGEDDSHLSFRVSLLLSPHHADLSKKIVTVTTVVIYHNTLGRIYFFFVKPFHKKIVTASLKRNFKDIETSSHI
jgi:hypothetical protein